MEAIRIMRALGRPSATRSSSILHTVTSPRFFATATASSKDTLSVLPWSEYLAIRKAKRKWEIATTIPATFGGFTGGLSYFGSIHSDPTALIMGIEPIWIYAAATLGCTGAGYLIGPFFGSSFWRLTHRKKVALIDAREREFHEHVVRNRVDPTRQSATNPVPDYYGENIGSIKQYRQWLRDQARFNKKAAWPED